MARDEKDNAESAVPREALASLAEQTRVRGQRFQQIYANNAGIEFSVWDMSLTFGEIVGAKDGKPVIEEIVKINITREMGKVLSQLLALNIAGYEKQFGEIKIPTMQGEGFHQVKEFPEAIDETGKPPAG